MQFKDIKEQMAFGDMELDNVLSYETYEYC